MTDETAIAYNEREQNTMTFMILTSSSAVADNPARRAASGQTAKL